MSSAFSGLPEKRDQAGQSWVRIFGRWTPVAEPDDGAAGVPARLPDGPPSWAKLRRTRLILKLAGLHMRWGSAAQSIPLGLPASRSASPEPIVPGRGRRLGRELALLDPAETG